MKTNLLLAATSLTLALGVKLNKPIANRDDDGSDEYDRLEESIHNDLDYADILSFSENVKDGKISALAQADPAKGKDEQPVDVTVNITLPGDAKAKQAGAPAKKEAAAPEPAKGKDENRIKKITLKRMDPAKLGVDK